MNVSDFTTKSADGRPVLAGASCLPPMRLLSQATNERPQPTLSAPESSFKKQKTADRFNVLNTFVDCSIAGLSKSELATWLCLYRDTRNGTACTAQADIAKRSGISVRSVSKAICKLKEKGLLLVVVQGGVNRGPSRYRLDPLRNRGS